MRALFVGKLDTAAHGVATLAKYVQIGRALGHEVAMFGEQPAHMQEIPFSTDVKKFDFAVFVVYQSDDFPDLPYLAQILDGIPGDRRVVIDPSGRYNDTIRVEHDFNHLERLDGHQGWEWVDAMKSVGGRVLQPTLKPRMPDAKSFLFYGFDPEAVAKPTDKTYGLGYIGNNWQRWTQIQSFLEDLEPLSGELGKKRIVGWGWSALPEWPAEMGLKAVGIDYPLLQRQSFETWDTVPYHHVIGMNSQQRFTPIFKRPLFKELGLVCNRDFETFAGDTIPLLALPEELAVSIYGEVARPLVTGLRPKERVAEAMKNPQRFQGIVSEVRAHLAVEHSFKRRLETLAGILEGKSSAQS